MNKRNNPSVKFINIHNGHILIILLLLTTLLFNLFTVEMKGVQAASIAPNITSEAAILVDFERGQTLLSKNADSRLHIAVASKIMTAIIAVEKAKLSSQVIISKDTSTAEGALLDLEVGEKYSLENLLYAMLLENANNAANSIAEYVGGNLPSFVALMNQYAATLNMSDTHFANPTGLYDETQYTTASDINKLIKYALSNTSFSRIFSTQAKTWFNTKKTTLLVNQNQLFLSYEGVDGGKIGYNDPNLQTAITTATRNNRRIIAILLDCPPQMLYEESKALLDYGFDNFRTDILVSNHQVLHTINISGADINLISLTDVKYTYPKGENYIKDVSYVIKKDIHIPITKSQVLGTATFTLIDGTIINVDLYPESELLPTETKYEKFKKKLLENKELFYLIVSLIALELIIIAFKIISGLVSLFKKLFS